MRVRVLGAVTAAVALLAGGYLWADAADLVPGWFTLAPVEEPQPPFITAAPVTVASSSPLPVTAIDPDAPRPSAAVVQALAQAVRDDERTGDSTNIAVVDYLDGTVYADLSAADPQVPASTTKLLTVVAAVSALGDDATLTTRVLWDAGAATLTLVAGGDEMLAAGYGHGGAELEAGTDPANGWAGIADLADQVAEALDDAEVTGDVAVAVDDSAFEGPAWPEEWPDYARNRGYAAAVTGLAVDIARIRTEDNADAEYTARYEDPSVNAGEVLAAALADRGVTVADEVTRAAAGSGAVEVAAVESAPLSEIARHLLAVSDNTVAESLARVLAIETGLPGDPEGAATATRRALKAIGVDITGIELYDGAGFSERNQISPATLASSLLAARDVPALDDLLSWLPLSGLEGTVETRFADTPVAGYFRAKTGSLTGVTTIAGVIVTAEGRPLAVAILADGMPYGQTRPKAAFDEFLTALAECGCEG
ncbi:D-alanyl-D-alanine carboxypeptidase/D-alanyl-D-alanine endopeptidase [Demequina lignilytica]|uniref:D-alanyl-D-alanine carboxypeptidase/D-alanyl-D-alanine-endopeptidase n=1 Tax=Demequina lignilytica TaxID=3051663 RepID=A0AB35MKK3_9MICO|nr:D-alanyl-D-alanine carboxypeptidase/D-alanyl-D-alanine-endopeptidase [Demequina sp. SYSU T0a273]MDN4484203.1 D-alanyl-D-alanine carboxypeptidase/D-alanyl-D-alanine-endopeptidase [Demequina sp. SYSU T0a273]